MAVLTAAELAVNRRIATAAMAPVTWTKPQINAALQAVEDAAQSVANVGAKSAKAYFGQAIEATVPGVFSAGQKDSLFVLWSGFNARRGGMI